MNADLSRILDQQHVVDVITRLFVATDQRDWDAVRNCFEPHVRFDMTSVAGGNPATLTAQQIADGWADGLDPIEHIHHQAGNFITTVDGDQARAFCYGIAYHYRKTKSGKNTRMFVGSYDVDLRRHADHWKISAFKFNLKFIDGNKNLEHD